MFRLIVSMAIAILLATSGFTFAQEKSGSTAKRTQQAQPYEHSYSEGSEVKWEFGIRIGCAGGYARTTRANAPVPIEWPEQEVELYEETKSNNIKKIYVKKLKKNASYMAFAVPMLGNGSQAEAILRYRINRKNTLRPDDTDQFQFAKKMPRSVKEWLKPSPYIESREKRIAAIGKDLLAETDDQPAWDQVEAIYSWVRENVRYKFDEQIHTCLEALDSGHGDCEELSSLFIAICRSRGIPARAVWVPGHTYPEFYLEDATGKGHWFPCQVAGANHEFGEMNESRPILQKGDRFQTPVNRETSRYVKAGLQSADATGALSVEHLMQKVDDE